MGVESLLANQSIDIINPYLGEVRGWIILGLKTAGILLTLYALYLIVKLIFVIRNGRKLSRIEEKLDSLLDRLGKKSKKSRKKK